MNLKQLFLMLASVFFNLRKKASGPQENITEALQKAISSEVSKLGYKIMAGVVLVSVAVFSIVQFGRAIQIWLSQYENGYIYQIVAFGGIAVVSSWGLYRLFNKEPVRGSSSQTATQPLLMNSIASEFMRGFVSGYRVPRPDTNTNMINAIDHKNIY